jgi:hypothetical protein
VLVLFNPLYYTHRFCISESTEGVREPIFQRGKVPRCSQRKFQKGLSFRLIPTQVLAHSQLYTDALSAAISNPTIPKESIRIILANRSQAYFSYKLEHDALTDVNEALSPKYTDADSPKNITIKCLFRRARILCLMSRYMQANADYDELVRLVREMGGEPTKEQVRLKAEIDTGANASEGSKRRQKDELMRAIDVRLRLFLNTILIICSSSLEDSYCDCPTATTSLTRLQTQDPTLIQTLEHCISTRTMADRTPVFQTPSA